MITKWKKHAVTLLPTLFSKKAYKERETWEQREAQLFQEIGQLKFELDWLKKNLTNSASELRTWIEPKNKRISITRQCQLLGISRTTVYRSVPLETEENLLLMNLIDQIYTRYPFFGSRQMCLFLRSQGYPVNRKRIQRLMQIMALEAIYPKRHLSQPNKEHRIYPYLLRNTAIIRPDQVWSTDITYLRLADGFAYLAAYIDWFSRFVLSFEVSTTLDHQFCVSAPESSSGSRQSRNTQYRSMQPVYLSGVSRYSSPVRYESQHG